MYEKTNKQKKTPGSDRKCDSSMDLGRTSVNMLSAAVPYNCAGEVTAHSQATGFRGSYKSGP